jgi:hypothetical protein
MFAETVLVAAITYPVMLAAFYLHRMRRFHLSVMIGIMVFDLSMPFYLYLHRDWKTRLIDDGDIFSFLVWTHFGLIITLFVLYALQIVAGRRLLRGDELARAEHGSLAKGILLARGLVILSGALLVQPVKIA